MQCISCLQNMYGDELMRCVECDRLVCLCCVLIDWADNEKEYCGDCFYLAAENKVAEAEYLMECYA